MTSRLLIPAMAVALMIASCTGADSPVIRPDQPVPPVDPVPEQPDEGFVDRGFDLPTLVIDTPDSAPIVSKTEWIDGARAQLWSPQGRLTDLGTLSVKGRGNNTWRRDKKPYAIRLDKASELLGMPSDRRWDLLANWLDITKLRNDITFELARCCKGLAWTPHGEYVELVLNGVHLGNYYLVEHIKMDSQRVNIPEGGYIVEFDSYYDEEFKFRTSIKDLPVNLKHPDDESAAALLPMVKYDINGAEFVITRGQDLGAVIDLDSFIDFFIVNEITGNRELRHPKSTYFHKAPDGLLTAGPVWDFDYGTFLESKVSGWFCNETLWYKELFGYPEFVSGLKSHWNLYRRDLYAVLGYLDKRADHIRQSVRRDNGMWPVTVDTNKDNNLTYDQAVDRLRAVLAERLNWLDASIRNL